MIWAFLPTCIIQKELFLLHPGLKQFIHHQDGASPLIFYFAATKTAAPGEEGAQQVDPGSYMTVPASALGASATNKYLLVKNKTAAEGHWRVEL